GGMGPRDEPEDDGRGRELERPRLFREHDGDAVADGVGQAGALADQLALLAVVVQRTPGHRADQDFQQARVDRGGYGEFVAHGQAYCTDGGSPSPLSTASISSRAVSASRRSDRVAASTRHCLAAASNGSAMDRLLISASAGAASAV